MRQPCRSNNGAENVAVGAERLGRLVVVGLKMGLCLERFDHMIACRWSFEEAECQYKFRSIVGIRENTRGCTLH